jgi:hypothetical protein
MPMASRSYTGFDVKHGDTWIQRDPSPLIEAIIRMDDLIFPYPEALDPYSECFPESQKIIGSKKIIYLLTGIAKPIYGEDKILSIPQTSANRLKMVYLGRHNQVKGYDRLSRVIPPLLDSLNGSIFVAGRPGPLFAPSHPHWHEFGWTPNASGSGRTC